MSRSITFVVAACALAVLAACAVPLSQQLTGKEFALARNSTSGGSARIAFSDDKKYESPNGVPCIDDPLICGREGTFRVNEGASRTDQVIVNGDEEIAVAVYNISIIRVRATPRAARAGGLG